VEAVAFEAEIQIVRFGNPRTFRSGWMSKVHSETSQMGQYSAKEYEQKIENLRKLKELQEQEQQPEETGKHNELSLEE